MARNTKKYRAQQAVKMWCSRIGTLGGLAGRGRHPRTVEAKIAAARVKMLACQRRPVTAGADNNPISQKGGRYDIGGESR